MRKGFVGAMLGSTLAGWGGGLFGLLLGGRLYEGPDPGCITLCGFTGAIVGGVLGFWAGAAVGAGVGLSMFGHRRAIGVAALCLPVVAVMTVVAYSTNLLGTAPKVGLAIPAAAAALSVLVVGARNPQPAR